MLTTAQVEGFRANGFGKGARVLSEQEVGTLQEEMARVIRDAEAGAPGPQPVLCRNIGHDQAHPIWQIVNIWEASPAFGALIHHQAIAAEIAQLTGATRLR